VRTWQDLAGPGIGDYAELERVLPSGYQSLLTPRETQRAIFAVKNYIEQGLCGELNLEMVTVPLIVGADSGVNDMLDRDGSRTPIGFHISNDRDMHPVDAQIVQAATKWKRVALRQFDCGQGEGICTAEDILEMYPDLPRKQRETMVLQQYPAVFIIGIGWPLADGYPHEMRAADYDDWITDTSAATGRPTHGLNGYILVWNHLIRRRHELSSMGIRVTAQTLKQQLEQSGQLSHTGATAASTLFPSNSAHALSSALPGERFGTKWSEVQILSPRPVFCGICAATSTGTYGCFRWIKAFKRSRSGASRALTPSALTSATMTSPTSSWTSLKRPCVLIFWAW
jgi:aspartate-ammonia ligase